MTRIVALILAVLILYLVPFRIVRLYRRDRLTASNFALTFTVGWVLAILVVYYLGLANILPARRDPLLAGLGLLVAVLNFVLGYPIAKLFHRHILTALLKRYSGKWSHRMTQARANIGRVRPISRANCRGFGREQGMAALQHYSEYKSVFIAEQQLVRRRDLANGGRLR